MDGSEGSGETNPASGHEGFGVKMFRNLPVTGES